MPVAEVTVVVPTRNRRRALAACLGQILAQESVSVHVVVVDEASSDDTPNYLADLGASERRLTVVRNDPPLRVAGARNAGLARAATPWVAFCDDDDLWAPDKLAAQLAALAATPGTRWSAVGTVNVDDELRVLGHQRPPESGDIGAVMRSHNVVPGGGSSLLVDRTLVLELGGYDAWYTGCEDYGLEARLALTAPIATVDRPLVAYRVAGGSMSSDVEYMRTGHDRVLGHVRGDLDPQSAIAGDLARDAYLGRIHLRAGARVAAARHYAVMAARYRNPRQLVTAAGALAVPQALEARHAARDLAQIPESWREEAESWLAAVRDPVAAPVTPGR